MLLFQRNVFKLKLEGLSIAVEQGGSSDETDDMAAALYLAVVA